MFIFHDYSMFFGFVVLRADTEQTRRDLRTKGPNSFFSLIHVVLNVYFKFGNK